MFKILENLDEFDIIRARKETIACEDIVHFNNAGAALMPIPVSDVLHGYLDKEGLCHLGWTRFNPEFINWQIN